MEKENADLLYALPDGISDDECLIDLEPEQIPWERVPALIALVDGSDEWLAFEAARLLCHWGHDEGLRHLTWFVCERAPLADNAGWMPHRIWSHDETYRFALGALVAYWACKNTDADEVLARAAIFQPITRIVALSSHRRFMINDLFWLVEKYQFVEYVPCLKQHFAAILANPRDYYWKIVDCAKVLAKIDPAFVNDALAVHGKTLSDYSA